MYKEHWALVFLQLFHCICFTEKVASTDFCHQTRYLHKRKCWKTKHIVQLISKLIMNGRITAIFNDCFHIIWQFFSASHHNCCCSHADTVQNDFLRFSIVFQHFVYPLYIVFTLWPSKSNVIPFAFSMSSCIRNKDIVTHIMKHLCVIGHRFSVSHIAMSHKSCFFTFRFSRKINR